MGVVASGRTTVLIAHRLQTARRADRILVLDGGRVVEEGSHDELVAAGGPLRRDVAGLRHPGGRGRVAAAAIGRGFSRRATRSA